MTNSGRIGHATARALKRGRLALLLLLAPMAAMADRFDIATFDAPPGWSRQAVNGGLMFESRPAGTSAFCQMLLSRSRKPSFTLAEELDRAWAAMLERSSLVGEAATPAQHRRDDGVTLAQRVAQVRAGGGTYLTVLNLLQKDDRLVMVVVNAADAEAFDRCSPALGDFLAGLKLDTRSSPQPAPAPMPDAGGTAAAASPPPRSDAQLAARFGNSVVGTWRYAFTPVTVTLNAPRQVRQVIEIRFARDATYRITHGVDVPGSSKYSSSETGTYRVDGARILMRPQQTGGKPAPYALDWFFGDHPDYRGNWGLILRSGSEWLGGDKDDWRTFKPAE